MLNKANTDELDGVGRDFFVLERPMSSEADGETAARFGMTTMAVNRIHTQPDAAPRSTSKTIMVFVCAFRQSLRLNFAESP